MTSGPPMNDEALKLLDEIRRDVRSGRPYPAIAPRIDAFLANIPETAAREVVLVEALRKNIPYCSSEGCQEIGVWIWSGPYGDRHQCDEHKGDARFTKVELDGDVVFARAALADTSPAAAALLAQVAAHEGHELRREEPESMGLQQLGVHRLVCATCEARAGKAPREESGNRQ